ncbi:hypothetical protein DH2020_023448 [Rehmannia glutinosa]|uniref:Chromo domain-containing protein n=1 Tax=Rehmannia glutinosa TaxID=99300 RepID=A0ABR0WAG1_REHGL
MKGGKRRNTNSDPVQLSAPPPPDPSTAMASVDHGGDVVGEDRPKTSEDSERFEAAQEAFEEEEGEEEDSEGEKEYEQPENVQIEEAEGLRARGRSLLMATMRLRPYAESVSERRGWSEAANTWEPVENLLQCSDIIDAFEERFLFLLLFRSPAAATYNVPSHVIRIAEGPISFPRLNDLSCTNEREANVNGINNAETSRRVNEYGARMREEEKEQSELNLKLCELKGAMVISTEDADRLALTSQEGQLTGDTLANGLRKTDGVDPIQLGRCTGAKKRKSGSVKRFKKIQRPALWMMQQMEYRLVRHLYLCPVLPQVPSYSLFWADGTKVTVDNKFLKANNPLLKQKQWYHYVFVDVQSLVISCSRRPDAGHVAKYP